MCLSLETFLTFSGETSRPGEPCHNFSFSNDRPWLVNFPAWISVVLLFWIYLFLLTLVFVLQWLFLHWEILIMLLPRFPLIFRQIYNEMPLFHSTAYDYSCPNWDGLRDHLRGVPWEDIFKLSASAAAIEFCEWLQAGIDLYIPHRKYKTKSHLSPRFTAACAAALFHRNHSFCFYQQNKSSESKVKCTLVSTRC